MNIILKKVGLATVMCGSLIGLQAQPTVAPTAGNGSNALQSLDEEESQRFAREMQQARPWPDDAARRKVFQDSAEKLRTALDTNQLQTVYAKLANYLASQSLTNTPKPVSAKDRELAIACFEKVTKQALTDLSEMATLLSGKVLDAWAGHAEVPDSRNKERAYLYSFYSTTNGPIWSIMVHTIPPKDNLEQVQFFPNGKLERFCDNRQKGGSIMMRFRQDGRLQRLFCPINKNQAMTIEIDDSDQIAVTIR